MKKGGIYVCLSAICFVIAFACVQLAYGCNEAVCASIVSKCLLTQSCKCDLKNCTCCKNCSNCLNYLYTECCSCVDMCPNQNVTETEVNRKSHVEELTDAFPELFGALTQGKDDLLRWVTYTFPAHQDLTIFNAKAEKPVTFATSSDIEVVNCTVAYMSSCMSWNKCKASCLSMGASSYRWFHDACCECIGSTCLNYGINESRCLQCPPTESDDSELDEIPIDETAIDQTNDLDVDNIPKKRLVVEKTASGVAQAPEESKTT